MSGRSPVPETKKILPTGLHSRTPEQDGSIIVHEGRRYEVTRIFKHAAKGTVHLEVENQDRGGVFIGSLDDTERIEVEV